MPLPMHMAGRPSAEPMFPSGSLQKLLRRIDLRMVLDIAAY